MIRRDLTICFLSVEIEAEVAAKEAQGGSDSDDDSSAYDSDEEEDDDANLLTPAVDSQIFRTIAAIQAKDPRVYEDTKFFEENEESSVSMNKKKPTDKKITLKDYERDMLLKHGGFVDDEDYEANVGMTHRQEQEQLRNAFKAAVDSDAEQEEDEDDFLMQKTKTAEEKKQEEDDYRKFLLDNMKNDEHSKKAFEEWSNYKENPNVKPEDAFLMDYVLNRGWVDKKSEKTPVLEEVDEEKDEEYLDNVDRFESKYNFRFEEEGASTIKTYARDAEGSVRRKESKRAKRRAREKAHKAALKEQKLEELKQQKNQKMKEIHEKLKEIRDITGNKTVGLENIDLDGDFDPSIYDAQMSGVFDENYYDNEGDVNEKPVWDDDIATGLSDDDTMDADYLPGGDKYNGSVEDATQQGATDPASKKRKFNDLMEEYYALNYEDVIGGDLYTRFKYTKTEPENYGLTPEEILLADDTALNKYIGMKVLAP